MNLVTAVLPDGRTHAHVSPLDPDWAVAQSVGGTWTIHCYAATRRHAQAIADDHRTRCVEAVVVPTTITRRYHPKEHHAPSHP